MTQPLNRNVDFLGVSKFAFKWVNLCRYLAAVSVYGGSGVAAQIGELKRGCEIVACTPGRMIDILTTGAGRITNLRRVTYMVLDEVGLYKLNAVPS